MEWEIARCRIFPGEWRVEAVDNANGGLCYVTIFSGPSSEQRAREYFDFVTRN